MADLDTFIERLRTASPFVDNRVNGPSTDGVTVDAIHARQFERLTALAREARDERRGLGAVLWGEAGIGKSHLLTRLSHWAAQDKNACFVYLHNLQAGPDTLARSLLKSVVSILTWGRANRFSETLLFRLVNAGVREALAYDADQHYSWLQALAAFNRFVTALSADDPSRAALVDRTAYQLLFRFFRSAYRGREEEDDEQEARLAVRWLSGDYLDPGEAKTLGLAPGPRPDEPVAPADDQQIKQILIALCQLALCRGQPFILCFDQVDNLDVDQAAALARFLEALIDSAPNLLVVLAGVQATLYRWREMKVIQDSAWDRLAQFEIALQRIVIAEGQAILTARLARFWEPWAELDFIGQAVATDPLFPLGRAWFEDKVANKDELRPRDVINWARERWRQQQDRLQGLDAPRWLEQWNERPAPPPPPRYNREEQLDQRIAARLQEQIAQHLSEPHGLPADADHLAGLINGLLEQAKQVDALPMLRNIQRPTAPRSNTRPTYDICLEIAANGNQVERVGLACVATASAISAANILRRLAQDGDAPDRLLLLTVETKPLPRLGPKGQEYLDQLAGRGPRAFRSLTLAFADYAALDALQVIVGLARSGDLELDTPANGAARIEVEEVLQAYRRRRHFRSAGVLRQIFAPMDVEATTSHAATQATKKTV